MATTFGTSIGQIVRESATANYTNDNTSNKVLFSIVIPANAMVVDKPYNFSCDMSISIPLTLLPTINFSANFASNTLNFLSGASLIGNVTNGYTGLVGYLVKRANGNILIKFSVTPTGGSSPITLSTTNTTQVANWISIDTTIDQTLTVYVAFGGVNLGSNITLVRQMYSTPQF